MATFIDILSFRRMVSPVLLQILFWAGIGGTLYGSWVLFTLQHWAWPVALIFGVLLVRVIFERAIIAFRSYDALRAIQKSLQSQTAGGEQ